jgi:very-short-patch-repair endonuclease
MRFKLKHTTETKQQLSNMRKDYLSRNPDKRPWKKNTKFKSVPCENVKDHLKQKGIKFVEEYMPLTDRSFAIDIAFPDIKVGIEVNGNQHYTPDGKLHEYYQIRHDLITAAGWKLIQLHYSSCFDVKLIDSIIESYEQPSYDVYFSEQLARKTKYATIKAVALEKREQKVKERQDKANTKLNMIISSININQWGWQTKAAAILNMKPQKISKWMKKYHPHIICKVSKRPKRTEPGAPLS